MKYSKDDQEQTIDYKELKQHLMDYCSSVKKLTEILHNANIIGTYSEVIVCEVLGLKKEADSHIYTDAKGADEATYQIKSRWSKSFLYDKNGQNEFGSFKYSEDGYPFDFLILVYYEDDLFKPKVFKIKSSDINSLFKPVIKQGEKRIVLRYNSSFKRLVEEALCIYDISNQFENIFI